MQHYIIVKVDLRYDGVLPTIMSGIKEGLDSDNCYKYVDRALIADTNSEAVIAVLDEIDLKPTVEMLTIDNT